MQQIAQGAEAKIYKKGNHIVKDRFPKKYRIKEIDEKLRKARTKREIKVLTKLQDINFPSPKPIGDDGKEILISEHIQGDKVRDILEKSNYKQLAEEIGNKLATLHNNNIIHGDLTTSNMILNSKNNEIYFIDFGLSFFSHKIEDCAVDLHLLKEALESTHHKIYENAYKAAINGYKKNQENWKEILKRLETVEKRGRYKGK